MYKPNRLFSIPLLAWRFGRSLRFAYPRISMMWRRKCAVAVAGTVLSGSIAFTGVVGTSGVAGAQPAPPPPTTTTEAPFTTPNTDSCPFTSSPAPAIDLSEAPAPRIHSPRLLSRFRKAPVGGDKLGECGVVLPDGAPPAPGGHRGIRMGTRGRRNRRGPRRQRSARSLPPPPAPSRCCWLSSRSTNSISTPKSPQRPKTRTLKVVPSASARAVSTPTDS